MAVFPKSANKDTLPLYKIQFKSPCAAHLRIGISSYDRGSHFERNFFKSTKMNDFKNVSTFYYIRYTPKLQLSVLTCSFMWNKSCIPFGSRKKRTKNLWGWSTMSLIGEGHNFMTSMSRSSQDNFCGKNS